MTVTTAADYSEKIPNNVSLADDRRLQRALEAWQPNFLSWWDAMGPSLPTKDVYLRTAINVGRDGWAQFGYVRMPEYRWGIFLQPRDEQRLVNFGRHKGQAAWQEVPGEYRSALRRVIVTQGDTEPASVEQQKALGLSCPSLYDLRNIFQVNVEEGRHLWAMVYLLHRYFGRDGRGTIWDNRYRGKTPRACRFRRFCNREYGICNRGTAGQRGSDLGDRAGACSRSGDHRGGSVPFTLRRRGISINWDFGRRSPYRARLGGA